MPEYQHWLLTEEAHIATLTLNRPDVMNSLIAETLYELRDVTAYLRTRGNVWVVIVQGRGDYFSIGMDVSVIKGRIDQPEQVNLILAGALTCLAIATVLGFLIYLRKRK